MKYVGNARETRRPYIQTRRVNTHAKNTGLEREREKEGRCADRRSHLTVDVVNDVQRLLLNLVRQPRQRAGNKR